MSNDRARLLMHPVRMRVVIALSARELTTRQISCLVPDVPQASLYRAIGQLHEAQVIEVAKEERRGGAMERTYRMAPGGALVPSGSFTSGTEEEFLGVVQMFADVIVSTAARHLALAPDTWREDRYAVRHESLWLTRDERDELSEDLDAIYAKYRDRERPADAQLWALMVAAIPDHTAPDHTVPVGGEDEDADEGAALADSDNPST